jgi:6-hydroxynicotinate 3-monooxygenase
MDPRTRIAVIGAGLGGLTAAGFLQRAGFPVTVYEQASAFSRVGAGIILSANVVKVLRRLGIEDDLVASGIKPDRYLSRAWDSGEIMYEIAFDGASERHFGAPYLNIHRGDLHRILSKAVAPGTVMFDHRLMALEEKPGAVRLVFANGATTEADIVVGGDGIRSKVRDHLLGEARRASSARSRIARFSRRNALAALKFRTARNGGDRIATSCPTL